MITLAAALKEPKALDGVVLMGPLIYIDLALVTPMKLWLARMLCKIAPNLAVDTFECSLICLWHLIE